MESFENPQGAASPVEPKPRSSKPSAKTATAKAKTPRVRKAAASARQPAARARQSAKPERPPNEALAGMIATEAYFRAAERSFAPGHELDDWLAAERKILALYQ